MIFEPKKISILHKKETNFQHTMTTFQKGVESSTVKDSPVKTEKNSINLDFQPKKSICNFENFFLPKGIPINLPSSDSHFWKIYNLLGLIRNLAEYFIIFLIAILEKNSNLPILGLNLYDSVNYFFFSKLVSLDLYCLNFPQNLMIFR